MSNNKPNEFLGVNKIGKNIRKSSFNQPDVANNHRGSSINNNNNNNQTKQQLPQPQIYIINKNDFRSFVQQITGSSASHHSHPPEPEKNPPRHPSMRLQKIPLTPMTHPRVPQVARLLHASPGGANQPPVPTLSPTSAFMQQLESCIRTPRQYQMNGQPEQLRGQQLSSSNDFYNMLSPYNLVSPRVQYQPPLSPFFAFSPGFVFPRSPSGFFPVSSPRWRNQ